MNEAEDIAIRNAPAFSELVFDSKATRRHHLQAMAFFWSDELPHENSEAELEYDYYRFVIFLLSYRAELTRGVENKKLERYKPLWDAFHRACPNWPGFDESRRSTELVSQLSLECDRELYKLERVFRICERKKSRDN